MNNYVYFFDFIDEKRYWMFAINSDVPAMIPGATNIEQEENGKRYDGIGFFYDEYNVVKENGKYIVMPRPKCPACGWPIDRVLKNPRECCRKAQIDQKIF